MLLSQQRLGSVRERFMKDFLYVVPPPLHLRMTEGGRGKAWNQPSRSSPSSKKSAGPARYLLQWVMNRTEGVVCWRPLARAHVLVASLIPVLPSESSTDSLKLTKAPKAGSGEPIVKHFTGAALDRQYPRRDGF